MTSIHGSPLEGATVAMGADASASREERKGEGRPT